MASAVGGALLEGNSKLLSGPLGIVRIGFNGYDLGKTTQDSNLTPDQDIKDILFQQDGTKPADHVRTGIEYMLNVTFGEIKTSLIKLMMSGFDSDNLDPNDDYGIFGRSLYQSMRDQEAKPLRIVAVDENGAPLSTLRNIINFYEAIPIVDGALINWGADSQRELTMSFRIKYHIFADGESATNYGAFGYFGDPTDNDVPAVVWPDVAGPDLISAEVTAATTMDITFGENVAFQGAALAAGTLFAKVNGVFVEAASGSITGAVVTATFPAATFAAGDTVRLYITSECIEDTEATPNEYEGVDDFIVTNSLV